MGNAYSAVVRNKDALFYNPAGLARVRGVNLTLLNLRAGANGQNVYDTYNSAKSTTGYASALRNFYGKNIWIGAGGKAAVTLPGFGFAAYDSADAAAYLNNPAFPNLNLRYTNDYGFATGIAFDLVPTVHVGISAQRITRTGYSAPVSLSTLGTLNNQTLIDQITNTGSAYSGSAGVILGIPTPALPRFSVVWKDIGQTTFSKDSGQRAPPPIFSDITAGFAFDVDLPLLTITPSFDYKHITDSTEVLQKKIHMGIELDLPLFDLRAGSSQGYYTAGIGFDLGLIQADAATYGVELGEYPGQKEDRRYVLEATIEFGFDFSSGFLKGLVGGSGPDGSSGSSSGSRGGRSRGLKQRR